MFNVLPLIFVLLTIAQFKRADSVWFWKLSLASTELAHLFVMLVIIWVVWARTRKKRRRWPVYLLGIFFTAVFLRPAVGAYIIAQNNNVDFSVTRLFTGETYEHVNVVTREFKRGLNLDIYQPSTTPKSPKWLMVVHGGGWDSGDSTQVAHFNHFIASHLDMTVVSVNYRLAPEFHWPAATSDVAQAITYIKDHASELHIDPQQYFLLGRSAGGQIAGEVAYNYSQYKIDQPKGLILLYSPTDMVFGYEVGGEDDLLKSRGLIRAYMGGPPELQLVSYNSASLTQLLSTHSTPTLLIHGENDFLTWFKHSERLNWRLARMGAASHMILLPWATHGFDFFLFGPSGQIALRSIEKLIATGAP